MHGAAGAIVTGLRQRQRLRTTPLTGHGCVAMQQDAEHFAAILVALRRFWRARTDPVTTGFTISGAMD